jgi:hypothetical protein
MLTVCSLTKLAKGMDFKVRHVFTQTQGQLIVHLISEDFRTLIACC